MTGHVIDVCITRVRVRVKSRDRSRDCCVCTTMVRVKSRDRSRD